MKKYTEQQLLEFLAPFSVMGPEFADVELPSEWKVPDDYTLEKIDVDGSIVERLIPKEKKTDLVILHFHGGSYAFRYMDGYRDVALQYAKVAGGAEVISLDYGCAPNHVFPSALEEAAKVYQWMLDQGIEAKNIVIAGDSAGGNLTMVATMYIRDNKMPMPKAIITISPWVYLGTDFDSMERNKDKDLIIGVKMPGVYETVVNSKYPGDTDIKTPYLSPLFGDFHDFPPMLIQCGDSGILYDPIVEAAKKIGDAGVDLSFTVYEGMFHDFQLFLPMLDESEMAWKEIGEFFGKVKNL